jgi:hypothetical protein
MIVGNKAKIENPTTYNVSSLFNELRSGIGPVKLLFPSQLPIALDYQSLNPCPSISSINKFIIENLHVSQCCHIGNAM